MANNKFEGNGGEIGDRFTTKTAKTYDPWNVSEEKKRRGEGITFVDVWLTEGAADKDEAGAIVAEDVLKHVASEKDLYRGFESELAEIKDESFEEQGRKLANTASREFFPDTPLSAPKKSTDEDFFPKF